MDHRLCRHHRYENGVLPRLFHRINNSLSAYQASSCVYGVLHGTSPPERVSFHFSRFFLRGSLLINLTASSSLFAQSGREGCVAIKQLANLAIQVITNLIPSSNMNSTRGKISVQDGHTTDSNPFRQQTPTTWTLPNDTNEKTKGCLQLMQKFPAGFRRGLVVEQR